MLTDFSWPTFWYLVHSSSLQMSVFCKGKGTYGFEVAGGSWEGFGWCPTTSMMCHGWSDSPCLHSPVLQGKRQSKSCLVRVAHISLALINWINGEGSGIGERLGEAFQRKLNCGPWGQGGSREGVGRREHVWIWMRQNWVKTEETAAFIRPPTLWSSCLICMLLLCKSVIMKHRGFFHQRKNKQMLAGFGKGWFQFVWRGAVCVCYISLGEGWVLYKSKKLN